jgi:hypothetical protein
MDGGHLAQADVDELGDGAAGHGGLLLARLLHENGRFAAILMQQAGD